MKAKKEKNTQIRQEYFSLLLEKITNKAKEYNKEAPNVYNVIENSNQENKNFLNYPLIKMGK